MWITPEQVYICHYAENCSLMIRINPITTGIEIYIQNYDDENWEFCFSVTEKEYSQKTGQVLPVSYNFDGEAFVRTYMDEIKKYEHPMEKEPFIPFVDLADFRPGEDGFYSLKNGQLVKVDAAIERIETVYGDDDSKMAKILLEQKKDDAIAIADRDIYEDFMADFKEGDKVRVTGRVYLPADQEEDQLVYFDAYKFEFR